MKIGIFDSGLGGLIMTKALVKAFPEYDHAYLGDTANLPYGARSLEQICALTERAVNWLFHAQNCALVIIACNTATIAALDHLQNNYLPALNRGSNHAQNKRGTAAGVSRRILGIVAPTVEAIAAGGFSSIGILATEATTRAGVYETELRRLMPNTSIKALAAPLLVPLLENGGDKYAPAVIADYALPFAGVDALVLGCTHYPYYKDIFSGALPGTKIISQDDILPKALNELLQNEPDLQAQLSRTGSRFFGITDINGSYLQQAERIFGGEISVNHVVIS